MISKKGVIMASYWKFIQYVLITVLGSTGAAMFDGGGLSTTEVINIMVLSVTAAGVFLKSNTPTQPWAKAAVAIFGAGATVLAASWTDQALDSTEVCQIFLALIGAIQVGTVANATDPDLVDVGVAS